ncbi:helix-turn-helix transcriptional regulator [Neobacillus dielmonensis]|uniref:helix-turn-helix transcriptional regulator n=1 Tax=Neobacillus dielmonensis TaxID=1347369 RepID=UPI000693CDD8|nr:AraC family transcriptional regulator [Neobacillus dielmonensis]
MGYANMIAKIKHLWNGSYHRNSFILILLITSIPGLIVGLGIYWFAVGKVEDELRASNASQTIQRAKNIDEQFKYIEEYTSHWAFEPRFGENLKSIDFVKQFSETYDITKTLLLLEGSHNLIGEAELYLDFNQPILFDKEYNVLNEKQNQFYHNMLSEKGTNLHWEELPPPKGQKTPNLAFVSDIPIVNKQPFGAIIVTIDHEKALNLLKTLTPYDHGATFLLNENNQLLLSSNSTGESNFISVLKKELSKQEKQSGSFQFEYNHINYLISYGHFSRITSKWTYISASPMNSITEPIVFISRLIMIISGSALLLAIILSWITSQRIYAPIRNLLRNFVDEDTENWKIIGKDAFSIIEQQWTELSQKSNLLQHRLSEQLTELKGNFIYQLVQGDLHHYHEEELRQRMETYGWKVKNQNFIAIELQLTGTSGSKESSIAKDHGVVTYMTANIMEELAQKTFQQFNIIKFSDLSVGMLVIYPAENAIEEELERFATDVTEAVNRIINMHVTITISDKTNSLKKVPYIFEDVKTGNRFRIYENSNQIIDLRKHKHAGNANFQFPFAIEKEIIQAIRMGQVEEMEALINKFIQEFISKGISEIFIQQAVIQLFSSIQHEILHSGIDPLGLFNGKNMIDELSKIRDPDHIVTWFTTEVIGPYIEKLESRLNMELKCVVEKVVITIQERYMEDISLESCADDVGTNPYTLSKAFKQIIGINFIDYLTQLRMDKAKDLLIHSDMKINDIAESVGYRHSYFNRIFKKQIGIPPSQYRKLNQDANQYKAGSDG